MEFQSQYKAHKPDENGFIHYSEQEEHVWRLLYERQIKTVQNRACKEHIAGLAALDITPSKLPQIPDLSKKLHAITGWQVAPVAALISARDFFELLAKKFFPVATFIRTEAELDYVKEPDVFHEVFGHCPMLTDKVFAQFVHDYACTVLKHPEQDWPLLQRLFWFTVEFGLIKTEQGLRAYGGGILSSMSETIYSVESDIPIRAMFDPIAIFRTPYRIDALQVIYFVIDDYRMLYDCIGKNLHAALKRARTLREFPPLFPVDPENPNIHILAC